MHQYFLTQINWGGPLCTTQRLKPICYKLLSSCAFSFNLRRYITGEGTPGLLSTEIKTLYDDCDKDGNG